MQKNMQAQKKAEGMASVYRNRWELVAHAITELEPCALECEALWGTAIRTKSYVLLECARDLSIAIATYLANEESDWKLFRDDDALRKRTMETLCVSAGEDSDTLSQKIKAAIAEIDNVLRPYLGRAHIREKLLFP